MGKSLRQEVGGSGGGGGGGRASERHSRAVGGRDCGARAAVTRHALCTSEQARTWLEVCLSRLDFLNSS